MKIAIPKETKVKENRVAITPDTIKELIKKGFSCTIEKGAGENSYFKDEVYTAAGATVAGSRKELFANADIVLAVNPPAAEDIASMKKEAVLISFMYAATHPDLVKACVSAGIYSIFGRCHTTYFKGAKNGCP